MKYTVKPMTLERYDEIITFWKNTEGIWQSNDDDYENLEIFLKRNPKTNFLVLDGDKLIGTVKCSHDGRRGYIHHLAVSKEYRKQGIAKELVDKCTGLLRKEGIKKIRVFVLDTNIEALEFWQHIGFEEDTYDYRTYKKDFT